LEVLENWQLLFQVASEPIFQLSLKLEFEAAWSVLMQRLNC
jgi:hypothetical protein